MSLLVSSRERFRQGRWGQGAARRVWRPSRGSDAGSGGRAGARPARDRGQRSVLPGLDECHRFPAGHRSVASRVIHAFGHGHLGLTLAPITARLVAELITGRGDPARLAAFSADRFRA
ncbi:FAD-dependent oxidoreductase [Mesorhizobium sp. M0213]|uniref:FAD-dependent oxidoreductase n=1 Tax=unclassified Mesorhizobium TaxID=325217 RepID=UPI00333A882F